MAKSSCRRMYIDWPQFERLIIHHLYTILIVWCLRSIWLPKPRGQYKYLMLNYRMTDLNYLRRCLNMILWRLKLKKKRNKSCRFVSGLASPYMCVCVCVCRFLRVSADCVILHSPFFTNTLYHKIDQNKNIFFKYFIYVCMLKLTAPFYRDILPGFFRLELKAHSFAQPTFLAIFHPFWHLQSRPI